MSYCLVRNNQIEKGPMRLPKTWKNISRLDLLTDEELKGKGWLPVIIDEPEYSPKTQCLSSHSFEISEDSVHQTYKVIDLSGELISERLLNAKKSKKERIKNQVQEKIEEKYPPYFQRNVALGIYSAEKGSPMKSYITDMILEAKRCENDIDSATDLEGLEVVEPNLEITEKEAAK